MQPAIIVLIGGGHAAGKKTTADLLLKEIYSTIPQEKLSVELIDLSSYTSESASVDLSQYSSSTASAIVVNKDKRYPALKPSRFNFDQIKADLRAKLSTPADQPQKVYLVHGLYALYDKDLRDMAQLKVFIDSDADARLIRWIRRDVLREGTDACKLEAVINTYLQGARAEMSDYIFPTKEFADVIMPRGAETTSVSLIFDGIVPYLSDSNISQPERRYLLHVSGNYLRPSGSGLFKEKFDAQKNTFYELN